MEDVSKRNEHISKNCLIIQSFAQLEDFERIVYFLLSWLPFFGHGFNITVSIPFIVISVCSLEVVDAACQVHNVSLTLPMFSCPHPTVLVAYQIHPHQGLSWMCLRTKQRRAWRMKISYYIMIQKCCNSCLTLLVKKCQLQRLVFLYEHILPMSKLKFSQRLIFLHFKMLPLNCHQL